MKNYLSIREHDENGRIIKSSIKQEDDGSILISVDGHQIALDDARCLSLMRILKVWQEKKGVRVCHEICDACYNCLQGQKGNCKYNSEVDGCIVGGSV